MPITADSRYVTAVITTAQGADGETRQEMRVPTPRSRMISYTFYRVLGTDRIDTISYAFYGRADLWWRIANANPEILDWLNLPAGVILRIPDA